MCSFGSSTLTTDGSFFSSLLEVFEPPILQAIQKRFRINIKFTLDRL